jgi:hypothetical protein
MKTFNTNKLLAAAGLFAISASSAMATDDDLNVRAGLNGFQQAPSIYTNATGLFQAIVYSDYIVYRIDFKNLSSPLTEAHIHFAKSGVNGEVMVEFCGAAVKCPAVKTGVLQGKIMAKDVLAIPNQNVSPGNFKQLMKSILNEATYVNLHSKNIDGEVRGQIVVDQ